MGGVPLWILILAVGVVHATRRANVFSPSDMDLDVQSPPHVTQPVRPITEYLSSNHSITVHCRATGNPPPTLQWKHNGGLISNRNVGRLKEFGNGTLVISSFSSALEGSYQCRAVSKLGVSLSHIVQIWERVEPKFANNINPDRVIKVREGQGVKLECIDKPYGRPPGRYSWYHVIDEKINREIPVHLRDRMDIDHDGNLYIFNAQLSDTADTYACAISALNSVNIARTPYVSLEVTRSKDQRSIPTVLGWTGQALADIGTEVTLECFFSGIPIPNVKWFLRNSEIDNGFENRFFLSPSGHKLTIKKLKDDDEGDYVCKATNSMGNATTTTFLNVTSPPLFRSNSPQLIVAPVGSDATFSCLADGAIDELPSSTPVWTVNGDEVSPNPRKFNVSSDGTQLTVFDVTKNDMMCLQCNVSNSRGYAFGDGYLIVIDPLVVVSQPNSTIEVDPATQEDVNLTIVATSDRCCPAEFSWAYNGKTLGKSALRAAPYSYQQGRNSATLSVRLIQGPKPKTLVDGVLGTFRCDVWNSAYADNTTVLVTLKLKEEPEPERVAEAGASLWWIGLVGGIIVLLLAIVAIVLMVRYNYPRQAYLLEKEEKKHKLNPEQDMLDHSFEEI